jgi:CubicO group peptidase (beta-lactamase class C family)
LKHRVNSVTKSVVGSLLAIALKEGTLKSLDQPVLEFFPGRDFAAVDARKRALTPRSLLDMTSGIDWNEPLSDAPPWSMIYMERSPDWVKYVLDHRMTAEPGTAFDYNSGNTHLLSAILSKATGRSAADYARDKLFGPLGIADVNWRRDPQGISTGGFGLYLQPRDMAKLGQLWLRGGVWEDRQLLPAEWTVQARKATVPMGLGPQLYYGNGFWSLPKQDIFVAVGFDGQLIIMVPKLDIVAVVTGATRYSTATGAFSRPRYRAADVVGRLQAAAKADGPIDADAAASADLSGTVARVAQERRTAEAKRSPLESAISGKVYRLAANELGVEAFSLTFEGGKASYAFDLRGQRWGGPIGLEGLYAVGGKRLFGTSAAKGTWRDDRTFQLEYQTLGNDDAALATLSFDGKSLELNVETLLNLKFAFKGTADD